MGGGEELGEGDGDEGAVPHSGVREGEVGGGAGFVFEKEKVEVEGAGTPADFVDAGAASGAFGGAEEGEEILGREGGDEAEDEVEEGGLVGNADGGGFVNGGGFDVENARGGAEGGDSGADGGGAVAKIGADADEGLAGRRHQREEFLAQRALRRKGRKVNRKKTQSAQKENHGLLGWTRMEEKRKSFRQDEQD